MTKQTISEKQLQHILSVFWAGSLIVISSSSNVKQAFWMSILIAGVLIIPLFMIYIRILNLYPGKNFFEVMITIFGKVAGRIFCLIYVFFAVHIASILMYIFSSFIRMLNMPETPEIATLALISLVSILSVWNGPKNIASLAKVSWAFIFVSLAVSFIIGLNKMDFNNLKPVFGVEWKTILSGALTFCLLPFGEAPLCLPFFSSLTPNSKFLKIFVKAAILFIFITLLANIRNVAILGFPSASLFYFPSYEAVSLLSLGEFFTRFEVIIGLNLVLAGLVKICVCLYTASTGLAKVMNVSDYRALVIPLALITITFSLLAQSNVQELFRFLSIYPFYAFPFEVIIPIIILIGAEIKTRMANKNGSDDNASKEESNAEPSQKEESSESDEQKADSGSEETPKPKHEKKSADANGGAPQPDEQKADSGSEETPKPKHEKKSADANGGAPQPDEQKADSGNEEIPKPKHEKKNPSSSF
jgi:spore germination protein KB